MGSKILEGKLKGSFGDCPYQRRIKFYMLYAICYLTHNSLSSGDMLKKKVLGYPLDRISGSK